MTIETDREDIKQIFAPSTPGMRLWLKALKEDMMREFPPRLPFLRSCLLRLTFQNVWMESWNNLD